MRRAARTDANHGAVVAALEAIGASVQSLAGLADGTPDLLVGYRGRTFLLEVKDGAKVPSKRALTPDQVEWHSWWRGVPVRVVQSPQEALACVLQT